MAFPASFIDELVARSPIEDVVGQYVTLKRSGAKIIITYFAAEALREGWVR